MPEQPPALAESALALFAARSLDEAHGWLAEAATKLAVTTDDFALRVALARAPRKLGRAALELSAEELAEHGLPELLFTPGWTGADLGRVVLVDVALAAREPARQVELVAELLRRSELGEQAAVLRGLTLFPEPGRFVEAAIDACRTNALDVFAAIANHNPYPATHFPDLSFNQMVLKALFMGVPVEDIVELDARASAELRRMVLAYASERRAAGRSVPAGVEYVVTRCPTI